jgi:hypothetical protein
MARRSLGLLALALFANVPGAVAAPGALASPRRPEPPRAQVETARPPVTGSVHRVAAGRDLQKALAVAGLGDVIVLEAGAAFVGSFELPAKSGSGWIIVTGSAEDRLPSTGRRVGPADAAQMPKLIARGGPALRTAPGAHHFRFVGIEFRPEPGTFTTNLIQLGLDETKAADLPHHFVFDRCVIHGDPEKGARRGIAMNSASTAVIDSYLADFKEVGADSQAIASWNGSGPFAIVNNYLEGAAENVLFGGADPSVPDLVPADIVIRGNHVTKPVTWKIGDRAYAGSPWSVKNLLELKNARRVLIEGNLFENNWPHAQNGFAILFTVRNQDGRSPWSVVEDVQFVNNVVRRVAAGFNVLGHDDLRPSGGTGRIVIVNNLFYEVGPAPWDGNGTLIQLLRGTTDIIVEHNTALQSGAIVFAEGEPHRGFVFRQNVVLDNERGVDGTDTGPGLRTLGRYFPGAVITGNVIIGGPPNRYPDGNVFAPSVGKVRFVNAAQERFRLAAGSQYRRRAGGVDPGADFDALAAALMRTAPSVGIDRLFASD